MGSVDNRIVHMEFDNALFEKGVNQTIQTLDKLDKGLDTLNDTHALDSLQTAADAITKKFSILGTMGDEITRRIANDFIDLGKKITIGPISAALNQIKTGGLKRSFNFENAEFQLQGLLKDQEKVNVIMQEANDSVDGTAYGYDEAAKAASQFAASGIQAGEEMESALRAITGVAAMTNSEYEGISQIFTTVAGNGRMMGDQLLQLSSRGLNAASSIAEFVNGVNDGSIQVTDNVKAVVNQFDEAMKQYTDDTKFTEQDIRQGVTKGIVSFQLFSDAMDSTFGEHAKQANATFNGAFANMKAALSRIGQDFIRPLIAQNGPLVNLFNAVRVQINNIHTGLAGISGWFIDWASKIINWATDIVNSIDFTAVMDVVTKHFNSFLNVLSAIGSILTPIGQAFKEVFFQNATLDSFGKSMEKIAKSSQKATEKFKKFWTESEKGQRYLKEIKLIFSGLFSVIKVVGKTIGNILYILSPLLRLVKDLFKWITDILSPLGLGLTKMGEAYDKCSGLTKVIKTLHKAVSKLVDIIEGAINPLFDFIGVLSSTGSITKAWDAVKADIKPFTDFLLKIGVAIADAFVTVNEKISELAQKYPIIGDIVNLFRELKDILVIIAEIIGGSIYQLFSAIAQKAPEVANSFKDIFIKFSDSVQNIGFFETIQKVFEKIGDKISEIGKNNSFVGGLLNAADQVKTAFSSIGTMIKGTGVLQTLSDGIHKLANLLSRLLDKMDNGLNNFYKKHIKKKEISNALTNVGESAKKGFKSISASFEGASKDSDKFTTKSITAAEAYGKALDTTVQTATAYGKAVDDTSKKSSDFVDSMKTVFNNFGDFLSYLFSMPEFKMLYNGTITGILIKLLQKFANGGGLLSVITGTGVQSIEKSIAGMGNSLSKFLNTLQDSVKTWQKNQTAKILKSIATAVLELAIAITILSNLDWEPGGNTMTATVAVAGFILELAFLARMLAKSGVLKLTKDKDKIETAFSTVSQIGTMMVKMALSMVLIAWAVSKLAQYPPKQIAVAGVTVGILMGVITALTVSLASIGKTTKDANEVNENLKHISGIFLAFGASMRIIASAIKVLAKIATEDPNALGASIASISLILGELLVVVTVIAYFNEKVSDEEGIEGTDSKAIDASARTLIAMALALQMLAVPIAMLALFDWTKLAGSVGALSAMLFVMMLMLKFISSFNKIKDKYAKSTTKQGKTTWDKENEKYLEREAVNLLSVGGALMMMAAALQMIAVPIAALALIPFRKMAKSVIILSAMLIVMSSILKWLSSFTSIIDKHKESTEKTGATKDVSKYISREAVNLLSVGGALMMMAAAIQMIAVPLTALALIKFDSLLNGIKALTIMLAVMTGLLIAIDTVNNVTTQTRVAEAGTNILAAGGALVMVALAVQMIAIPLAALALIKFDYLKRGLTAMVIMLGAMAGALVAITAVNDKMTTFDSAQAGTNILAAGGAIIAIALALQMLIPSLQILSLFQWKSIAKGLVTMGVLLGEITASLVILQIKGDPLSGAEGIVAVAFALRMMIPALLTLSLMPLPLLAKGLIAMAGSLGIITKALQLAGNQISFIAPAAIVLVGSVVGLAAAFLMTATATVKLAEGIAALALVAPLAGKAFGVIQKGLVTLIKGIVTLIPEIIKAIIEGFAESIPDISETFFEFIIQMLDMLNKYLPDIVDKACTLIINVFNLLKGRIGDIVDAVAGFFQALFAAITEATGLTGADIFWNLLASIAAIATLMVAVAALQLIAKEAFKGALELGVFIGILTGIFVGLGALSKIPGFGWLMGEGANILLQVGNVLTQVGITFGVAFATCAALSLISAEAIAGVVEMGIFVAALTGVIAAFGAISQIPGFTWLVTEGGNALQLVGTAIGQFVGGIVGGFAEGVSSTFPQIATDLSNFITNLQPFINGATQLNPDMLDGVNALVKTILLITAAEIIQGITSFLTGGNDLASFGSQIAELGTYFSQFAKNVSGLDKSTVDKANICAKSIKILAETADAIPNSGGLAGLFAGNNDIDDFGKQLKSFGKAFVDFANTVSGIDSSVVQNAKIVADSAKVIADMAKDIPNSGGVVSWFTGNNDLDDFGDKLRSFGLAFYSFAQAIANINPNVSTNAQSVADAAKVISDMAKDIPNSGGLISWFTGDNDLGTFGKNLQTFGNAFVVFGNSVGAIDSSAIESATNEFGKIIGLANLASAADTSGFDKFKEAFEKLGTDSINNFVNTFDGASEKVKTAIDKLISTAQNELKSGTSGILMAGTSLGTALSMGIINGINSNAGALNLSVRSIGAQITLLAKTSLPAATFSSIALINIIQPLAQGITGNQMLVIYAIQILISQIKITFMSYLSMAWFLTLGYTINQYLATGMRSGMGLIIAAAISMCSTIRSTFYANLDLYEVGQYAAQGLANGITSKVNDIANAAIASAKAAVNAARAALDEHSPSKVFYQMGQFIDQGLINGIDNYRSKVYDSGTNLGRAVIESMNSSLDKSNGLFDLGIDGNPVIRPILDLSDIDAKSDKIDSLFDGVNNLAATINLNGTISRAQIAASSFSNASTNQNGVNNNTPVGNNFNFVQNNYSPKALSRKEIYRQTRNQFSVIQGAMNSV